MMHTNYKIYILTLLLFAVLSLQAQEKEEVLTIESNQLTLLDVFLQLEEQTTYSIAYEHSKLDLSKPITLSLQRVSVSQALDKLLEGTGHTYKISGYHIILLPENSSAATNDPIESNTLEDSIQSPDLSNSYTYQGVVIDNSTQQPLAYATILLVSSSGKQIGAAISKDNGRFKLSTHQAATSISVSFVGYNSFYLTHQTLPADIGIINLVPNENILDETIVTAQQVEHAIDRTSYLITDKMRERASTTQELLDQIHGVRYDKLSNSIKVGNESAVLLLVDGIKQSDRYINSLPPSRIAKVEVVTEPSGRHLSDGYAAIINVLLRKDYNGYNILLQNFSMNSFAGYNGKDWLINDQPAIGLNYTKDKINLYANYIYGNIHMNTPVWKSQLYENAWSIHSEKTGKKNANNAYDYRSNVVIIGLNYQLHPKHTISIQGDYAFQHIRDHYLFNQQVKDLQNNRTETSITTNENKTRDKDYVGTVFYQGEIGEKMKLYSDFTYNYYFNDVENRYNQNKRYLSENLYAESKNYTNFNLEATYNFSPQFALNMGYVNVWRKYNSETKSGSKLLDYTERRNQLFAYLQYRLNDQLQMKGGLSVEYIRINSEQNKSFWSLQPYFQLNYKINDIANLNVSYLTNNYYPTLYQLSPLTTAIDSLMMQSGNPALESAVRHTVSAKLTLWDRLTINPQFKFTPKRISEIYTQENGKHYSTFGNISVNQLAIQAIYDQPLGEYFNLSSTLTYYYDRASHKDIKNAYHGWIFDAEVGYFNPRWKLGAQIGIHRSIDKGALLQGYQMVNMDSWLLSVQKQFWKDRASVMISYFPPIRWGVRDELTKEIKTPFYTENYTQSLSPYRNMLMVRLSLRFHSGKIRSSSKQSATEREERAKRAAGF